MVQTSLYNEDIKEIKCAQCGNIENHRFSFKFFNSSLLAIKQGKDVVPRFHIKLTCGKCHKFIKFVSMKDYLEPLDDKEIKTYG